jgi:hypothetical protein
MTTRKGGTSMIDYAVQQLLENTINSPTKLQLLLLFHENPRLALNAAQAANRMYRDIWSIREALHELALHQILVLDAAEEPRYCYCPHEAYCEPIRRLMVAYNDPLERHKIQDILHSVAIDSSYYRAKTEMNGAFELQRV